MKYNCMLVTFYRICTDFNKNDWRQLIKWYGHLRSVQDGKIQPALAVLYMNISYLVLPNCFKYFDALSLRISSVYIDLFVCLFLSKQPLLTVAQDLLIIKASLSHSDTPQSVGLLWTSDQPVAETSTWLHTTLTTDKHPWHWRDSNPQSQQKSGRRPMP